MSARARIIKEMREDAADVGELPWRHDGVAVVDSSGRRLMYPASREMGDAVAGLSEVLNNTSATPEQVEAALAVVPPVDGPASEGPAGLHVDGVGAICGKDKWPVLKGILNRRVPLGNARDQDQLNAEFGNRAPPAPKAKLFKDKLL